MNWKLGCAISALMVGAAPALAAAQTQPTGSPAPAPAQPQGQRQVTPTPSASADRSATEAAVNGEEEIVVTGQKPRGSVPGDIPPEQTLNPAEIRSYGVSSVADLLDQLAPQTGSSRGRDASGMPVVLLNGRRISSFAEIRDLPTEAITRVEILPEEAALKLGYRADQRVVNFVLRARFRAITAELADSEPTRGARNSQDGRVDVLRITDKGRVNLDVHYTGASAILESERNVAPNSLIPAPYYRSDYRTLSPSTEDLAINGVYNRALSQKVQATINLRLETTDSKSLLGPFSGTLDVPGTNPFSATGQDGRLTNYYTQYGPLTRYSTTNTGHVGVSLNGDLGRWRWSLTGNYDHSETKSLTDSGVDVSAAQALLTANSPSFNPFTTIPAAQGVLPANRSRSESNTGQVDALLTGQLVKLPAGYINTSLRVGASTSRLQSDAFTSTNFGITTASGRSARDIESTQLNVDVPITSRRNDFLSAIGDLSLNGNVEVEHLSDFGTLTTVGYGLNWAPIPQLRIITSVTRERGAPSASQLADPLVTTPNVRIFDYVRGTTVDITTLTGGNPALTADHRHVFKVGVNLRPFDKTDFNLRADYVKSSIRDAISAFPSPTAALEAAFPTRFIRDNGNLIEIDERPVNFQRTDSESLRWGFNISLPLKSSLAAKIQRLVEARRKQVEEARAAGKPVPPPDPELARTLPFPNRARGQGQNGQQSQQQQGQAANGQTAANGQPAQDGQTPPPPPQGGGFFGGGPGGPGGGPRGPGGGFRGRGLANLNSPNGPLAGRMMFSLFHTWHFREDVFIRPGVPELDLLNGAATGSRGGQPRHEVEASAGYFKDGIGTRLAFNWQSGTSVNGGTLGNTQRLDFSSLGTFNLSVFANLGQQVKLVRAHPFLQGARVTLSVTNLLDAHLHVTDQNGAVPLSYQPDLLDPVGRSVRISFRKLFF